MAEQAYDVLIVGGGVTGTALLQTLCRYTSVRSIALLEKYAAVAQVNSNASNNAQTSHDGGTETNYNLAHALDVKRAAIMLRTYALRCRTAGVYRKTHRMVLAVGEKEVAILRKRLVEFGPSYRDLRLADADELRRIEPKVMEGRDPNEPVAALVSDEGYAINYERLAESFLDDAQKNPDVGVFFNTSVKGIVKLGGEYLITTNTDKTFRAKVVVFAAGAYSLHFAHRLGQFLDYTMLMVKASFFTSRKFLNGKVYRVQVEGMPFAAIHGDPDVRDNGETRYGPTTKPVFEMEPRNARTFWDFLRIGWVSLRGVASILSILANGQLLGYVAKNWLYDVPVLGKLLFLNLEARTIVPSLAYSDLTLRKDAGGIRPQVVNLKTRKLEMGDATFVSDHIIFNTTPSPGASVCLANAERDAQKVVAMLGGEHMFDRNAFEHDHGLCA